MARVLFLPHRMPFPPDKGDKIRSYHLLKHLAARHKVTLVTFIDDVADEAHVPSVQAFCEAAFFARLSPSWGRVKGARALLAGGPMTLQYYRDPILLRSVREAARRMAFDAAVVFSSSMFPYAEAAREATPGLPILLDLVDVDSAKWSAYALRRPWPMSWPLAREGRTLLAYERQSTQQATSTFLCTEQERDLFGSLAPDCRGRVEVLRNGVDAEFYSPSPGRERPFPEGEQAIVFTGAMDYWPNVDGVCWFAREVLPLLRRQNPAVRLHIVGRKPTPEVCDLRSETVEVTGAVPDVRPYLQHASAVVAPLRVARGIQNKVLEAMAMARPVVTAPMCAAALQAAVGEHLMTAETPEGYAAALHGLLADPVRAKAMGAAARRRVLEIYSWAGSLRVLDERLAAALGERGGHEISAPVLTPVSATAGGS